MTTLHRRFQRWHRLRPYKPNMIPFGILLLIWFSVAVAVLIWLLFTSYAIASYERDAAIIKAATVQEKLDEAELMLTICLNGGTPAYYREGKQIVYIECVKAKERIYL